MSAIPDPTDYTGYTGLAEARCPCCEFIGDSAVATPLSASSYEHGRWLEHAGLCDDCRESIEDELEGDE